MNISESKMFNVIARYPVTLLLLLIIMVVYIAMILNTGSLITFTPDQQIKMGGNISLLTLTTESWRLVTNIFMHGSLMHLLMNALMLLIIGTKAEKTFGALTTMLVFIIGGILASCNSVCWQSFNLYKTNFLGMSQINIIVSVGASGAIFALLGALLVIWCVRSMNDEEQDPGFGRFLLEIIGINLVSGVMIKGIDQAAHIGGLIAGIILIIIFIPALYRNLWWKIACSLACIIFGGLIVYLVQNREWTEVRELAVEYQLEEKLAKEKAERSKKQEIEKRNLPAAVPEEIAKGKVLNVSDNLLSMAITKDEKTAYLVDHFNNRLYQISIDTMKIEKNIQGPLVKKELLQSEYCRDIFCGGPAISNILLNGSKAYVTSMVANSVSVIDLDKGIIENSIQVGTLLNTLMIDSQSRLFIHNAGNQTVSIVDTNQMRVLAELELRKVKEHQDIKMPWHTPMWINQDGKLWVLNNDADQFDLQSMSRINEDHYVSFASAIAPAISSEGPYVLDEYSIRQLDGGLQETIKSWPFCDGDSYYGFAIHIANGQPDRMALSQIAWWNGERYISRIRVINPDTLLTRGEFSVDGLITKMQFSSEGNKLYLITHNGNFVELDLNKTMEISKPEIFCVDQNQ